MTDLSVNRTLVKSPPELWTELSELETLARHLGELGEIRISKVEPEHTVAWEGEHARGTVEIEASGWGTKVTLSAEVEEPAVEALPEAAVEEPAGAEPFEIAPVDTEAAPAAPLELDAHEDDDAPYFSVPERRARWWRRWRRRGARRAVSEPQPTVAGPAVQPEAEPVPEVVAPAAEPIASAEDPEPDPEPVMDAEQVRAIFETTLDNLGQAHHRPFSRG